MRRAAAVLAIVPGLLTADPARALGADRYVNPNTGINTGDCLSVAGACKSITYTMTRTQEGDRVIALPGTYSPLTGETFPIRFRRGVEVIGRDGAAATTLLNDVGGTDPRTIIIHLEGTAVTAPTGFSGFTVAGAGLAANRYAVAIESFAQIPAAGEPEPYIRDNRILGFVDSGILLITYGYSTEPPPQARSLRARVEGNEVRACGAGIAVVTVALDGSTTARDDSLLQNNIVLGCTVGFSLAAQWDALLAGATGTGTIRTDIRHNTVLDAVADAIVLSADDAAPGNRAVRPVLANNILARSRGFGVREDIGDGDARFLEADVEWLAANALFGNRDGDYLDADTGMAFAGISGAQSVHNIPDLAGRTLLNLAGDPKVSSATGHLQAGSPCIDAASAMFAATMDFDREARPSGLAGDIGADELVSLLRRSSFSEIDPLTPERPAVLATLPGYVALGAAPFIDPDGGVLTDLTRKLVVYQLPDALAVPLRMTKAVGPESVTLHY